MLQIIIDDLNIQIENTLNALKDNLSKISIGRAQSDIFDLLKVNCYNSTIPLPHISIISVLSANKVSIQPHDKSLIKIIDKTIRESDLDVTTNVTGDVINVFFPIMTLDRRDNLIKLVNRYGEEAKVSLRNHRREALKSVLSNAENENEITSFNKKIELIVAQGVDDLEKLTANKNKKLKELK